MHQRTSTNVARSLISRRNRNEQDEIQRKEQEAARKAEEEKRRAAEEDRRIREEQHARELEARPLSPARYKSTHISLPPSTNRTHISLPPGTNRTHISPPPGTNRTRISPPPGTNRARISPPPRYKSGTHLSPTPVQIGPTRLAARELEAIMALVPRLAPSRLATVARTLRPPALEERRGACRPHPVF